jgi:cysteine desulfurase / selenocysteine lyase
MKAAAAGLFPCVAAGEFPVERLRQEFPALAQKINAQPLIYFDNAASTQKPRAVLEAMNRFYEQDYANIHRGLHTLAERATAAYEAARTSVRGFINAAQDSEIIFTRGATEAINLVAQSWGQRLQAGDEILITALEHHANIVPWQLLAPRGIKLVVAPIEPDGSVKAEKLEGLMTARTRLVAVAHISNVLGTVLPVETIIAAAHARAIPVLLDGCQAVAHAAVDMQALDADFYVFSAHKLYGPTGIGVLYGKAELLASMPPWQGGGDMVEQVSFSGTSFQSPPLRFEAGTPPIAEAIGLHAAIDTLRTLGMDRIAAYEAELLDYAMTVLARLPEIRIIGTAQDKAAILSFNIKGVHPSDLGTLLDQYGIAVRTGSHCAQPLMQALDLPFGTVRASFACYNTRAEIDQFGKALTQARTLLS